jgi:cephalosporin hydroxylase
VKDILTELASKYCVDKGIGGYPKTTFNNVPSISKPHGFTPFYSKHFESNRDEFRKILEIGVLFGNSLMMWDEYFPNAEIHGFDIDLSRVLNDARKFKMMKGDQSNRDDLNSFLKEFGGNFDLIIEDGGHKMDQQHISLGFLFKHVSEGGYYIVEDLHTSLGTPSHWGILEDRSNSMLNFLEKFNSDKIIESIHMSDEEKAYLVNHIEFCEIFYNNNKKSITSVIKKRKKEE